MKKILLGLSSACFGLVILVSSNSFADIAVPNVSTQNIHDTVSKATDGATEKVNQTVDSAAKSAAHTTKKAVKKASHKINKHKKKILSK